MSLASFAMFTGGGIGTYLNGEILTVWGFEPVFVIAGVLILLAGSSAAVLLQGITQKTSSAQLLGSVSA